MQNAEITYIMLFSVLFGGGILLLLSAFPSTNRKATQRTSFTLSAKGYLRKQLADDTIADQRFREIGLAGMNTYKYNIYRLVLLVVLIAVSVIKVNFMGLIASVALIYILTPSPTLLGFESPFMMITKGLKKRRGEKLDDEIYKSCVLLKNLAIVQKDKPWGAEYIYTQLIEHSKELRPMFADMIMQHRLGNDEKAFEIMSERIGTKTGKEFVQILSNLDSLNPSDMVEQLAIFQDALQERKLTLEMKKAETRSNIVYLATTLTMLILIVNFAMLVIFMDAMAQMNNLSVM